MYERTERSELKTPPNTHKYGRKLKSHAFSLYEYAILIHFSSHVQLTAVETGHF